MQIKDHDILYSVNFIKYTIDPIIQIVENVKISTYIGQNTAKTVIKFI